MIYRLSLYHLIMKSLDREMVRGHAEIAGAGAVGQRRGIRIPTAEGSRTDVRRHYFQFSFGSLYPVLRTLEKRGLARARWVQAARRTGAEIVHHHRRWLEGTRGPQAKLASVLQRHGPRAFTTVGNPMIYRCPLYRRCQERIGDNAASVDGGGDGHPLLDCVQARQGKASSAASPSALTPRHFL